MTVDVTAWRIADGVAYDVMRDLARSVISALATRSQDGPDGEGRERARSVHQRVTTVDPYDRDAVDATVAWLLDLRREMGGGGRG